VYVEIIIKNHIFGGIYEICFDHSSAWAAANYRPF